MRINSYHSVCAAEQFCHNAIAHCLSRMEHFVLPHKPEIWSYERYLFCAQLPACGNREHDFKQALVRVWLHGINKNCVAALCFCRNTELQLSIRKTRNKQFLAWRGHSSGKRSGK